MGNALLFSAGCVGSGYPIGGIYNGTGVPHQMARMEATGLAHTGDKWGQVCATGIMGAVAWDDASFDAAKKAGGITEVHSVEFKPTLVALGIYFQACTVVHGKSSLTTLAVFKGRLGRAVFFSGRFDRLRAMPGGLTPHDL